MSAFTHWTLEKQKALWLELAKSVIQRWNLTAESISWLGYSSNAVFKVTAADGDYVLRLHPPGRVDETRLRSELQWLLAIRKNTDLLAPFPVIAAFDDGEDLFVKIRHELLPHPHISYGALFEYIHGEIKSARELGPGDAFRIGAYLGELHSGAQIELPVDFDRPRLDWEGLFGTDSPYHSSDEADFATIEQQEIFAEVGRRVRAAMIRLDERGNVSGLIHADLLSKNVIFRGDILAALDFEFSGWGYFRYDLAPLLWQLKGERAADYAQLEHMLLQGYASVRGVAEAERPLLESFIAARQLASCRWLLVNLRHPTVREIAPSLLADRAAELKGFLETGILLRRTPTL